MTHRILDYARSSTPSPRASGDFYILAGADLLSTLFGVAMLCMATLGNADAALAAIGAGAFLMLLHVAFCVLPTTLFLCWSGRELSRGKRRALVVLAAAGLILPAAAICLALVRPGGLPVR